jgi:hypothetical protein
MYYLYQSSEEQPYYCGLYGKYKHYTWLGSIKELFIPEFRRTTILLWIIW